jgi:hypothetical protein
MQQAAKSQPDAVLKLRRLSARRRGGGRPPHLSHSHQGQIPTVHLLAGDAVLCAGPMGSRSVLCPAWHGRPELLTLDWQPVGTGPFYMAENDPNRRMVLKKNPHYHGETYPTDGSDEDRAAGLLADAGKPLPLVDAAVYSLEKETIPYWSKFLQGYYDSSGISSDSFDQAVQFTSGGDPQLTDSMREQGYSPRHHGGGLALVYRLQHARPGGRRPRGRSPETAAGAVDRVRLRRIHFDFSQRPRHSRAGADPARAVRLCRRRGRSESLRVRSA